MYVNRVDTYYCQNDKKEVRKSKDEKKHNNLAKPGGHVTTYIHYS